MKTAVVFTAVLASAAAFAPAPQGRPTTAVQDTFMNKIFGMDLFAPNPDVNSYGARDKKDLKVGKIGDKSYVPSGLTAAQYNKIRDEASAKKAANYKRNVAKAGKFLDYTDFYTKRGTDKNDNWFKSVTRGHDMAKTKYDWSGTEDAKGYDGGKKK
mmetsp:Transcript_14587/g.20299  ORF Transcript_14587/g.20299 Transcript_14587/m.20299 type:complete len:156 (+) Transcript_14587:93-560(+)